MLLPNQIKSRLMVTRCLLCSKQFVMTNLLAVKRMLRSIQKIKLKKMVLGGPKTKKLLIKNGAKKVVCIRRILVASNAIQTIDNGA